MEKIIEPTKKVFQGDFIRLSPKINELSEMLWFTFRMGGSVSTNIVTPRFPEFKKDLDNLVEMGVLKLVGAGNESLAVFTETFESKLLKKNLSEVNPSDIFNTLIDNYPKELSEKYKLEELMQQLATVLSAVIVCATPEEPAFLNRIFRLTGSAGIEQSKELLEYYLFKYLGLIQPVGSFAVNLSNKAVEVVKRNTELWEAYKAKPKQTEMKIKKELKEQKEKVISAEEQTKK